MKIIRAEKYDLAEILAVQKVAFYDVALYHKNFKIQPLLKTIDEIESNYERYIYVKAVEDSRIVGSARAYQENNICKIENVIVLPGFQGRGIGKELIKRIEDEFPGSSCFELFTGRDTPKNVQFYIGLGYSIIKEIPATDKEPVFVVMQKKGN